MAAADIEVYPDCVDSVYLFIDCMTQWRGGGMGVLGLDYTAVIAVMKLRGIKKNERSQYFDDIRVMELAALSTLRTRE